MSNNYLHGSETVEVEVSGKTITVVKSAVVGLVGFAPTGDKNTLILVRNIDDAAQFGKEVPGFTIPQALKTHFDEGGSVVFVVNCMPAVETALLNIVTDEAVGTVPENGVMKLDFAPRVLTNVKQGATVLVLDTDFTIDEFGNIQIIDFTTATVGSAITASYKYFDVTDVTNDMLIGERDEDTGVRTGMQLFDECYSSFGFKPKILIAPEFSTIAAIQTELAAKAALYKAVYAIDAPTGTTVNGAIAGRGPSGDIEFTTNDKRAMLCFPRLNAYDPYTEGDVSKPYSQFLAGLMARVDLNEGYWFSPSNHEFLTVNGPEIPITSAINDDTTDANALNEVGIMTVFNSFGSGFRAWGNRSAKFPGSSDPNSFICILRVADLVHESIEFAMIDYIDKPMTLAILDAVKESVNEFFRTLVGRGAIIDGVCSIDKLKNPTEELQLGHATFDYSFMPPPPFERATFNSFIDVSMLKKLTP